MEEGKRREKRRRKYGFLMEEVRGGERGERGRKRKEGKVRKRRERERGGWEEWMGEKEQWYRNSR